MKCQGNKNENEEVSNTLFINNFMMLASTLQEISFTSKGENSFGHKICWPMHNQLS